MNNTGHIYNDKIEENKKKKIFLSSAPRNIKNTLENVNMIEKNKTKKNAQSNKNKERRKG